MILKLFMRFLLFLTLLIISLGILFFLSDLPAFDRLNPDQGLKEAETEGELIDFSLYAVWLDQELDFEPGPKVRPRPEPEPAPPQTGGAVSKEQQMVNLINQARASAGLPPLQVSSQLTNAARAKSRDMIDKNYFSHTSPTYGSFVDLLNHFGVSYRSAAENLAMNSSGSVTAAHDMLMASPGHRNNILGSSYNLFGVGIQVRGDGSHFYTQLFVGY